MTNCEKFCKCNFIKVWNVKLLPLLHFIYLYSSTHFYTFFHNSFHSSTQTHTSYTREKFEAAAQRQKRLYSLFFAKAAENVDAAPKYIAEKERAREREREEWCMQSLSRPVIMREYRIHSQQQQQRCRVPRELALRASWVRSLLLFVLPRCMINTRREVKRYTYSLEEWWC